MAHKVGSHARYAAGQQKKRLTLSDIFFTDKKMTTGSVKHLKSIDNADCTFLKQKFKTGGHRRKRILIWIAGVLPLLKVN